MTKCANCGAEMGYGAFCPDCGSPADAYQAQPAQGGQPVMHQPAPTPQASGVAAGFPLKPDTGSVWWAVLSFFVPQAGLILWAIWRDYKPNDARKCGIGLIVFAAVMTIPFVLMIFMLVGLVTTGALIGATSASL